MANRKINFLLVMVMLLSVALACNAVSPQAEPTVAPATQVIATQNQTQEQSAPPLIEATVPRISAADAKAAFDSGKAIIVDVRSAESYAISHVRGAILIPLIDIENNPASLNLDKNQWIITYCT
jgi:predicted sulfurtransferase